MFSNKLDHFGLSIPDPSLVELASLLIEWSLQFCLLSQLPWLSHTVRLRKRSLLDLSLLREYSPPFSLGQSGQNRSLSHIMSDHARQPSSYHYNARRFQDTILGFSSGKEVEWVYIFVFAGSDVMCRFRETKARSWMEIVRPLRLSFDLYTDYH
jgi:hypothetical protein